MIAPPAGLRDVRGGSFLSSRVLHPREDAGPSGVPRPPAPELEVVFDQDAASELPPLLASQPVAQHVGHQFGRDLPHVGSDPGIKIGPLWPETRFSDRHYQHPVTTGTGTFAVAGGLG